MIENDIQNRFTGYLVSAVKNTRITYMEKKKRTQECESRIVDKIECTDFDYEYHKYQVENSPWSYGKIPSIQELILDLEEEKLIKAIKELKKEERDLLLTKIFSEKNFQEIGELFSLTAKQAEMKYYYIIRKMRKAWNQEE